MRGLTVAQQQAVESPEAPLCVLAAAGSGKTTVLARRVARRILDGSARAEHTLVVTFTRKASRELRGRLARLGVPGLVSAGTFHALSLAQLRRHWADRQLRAPVLVDDPTPLVRAVLGARAAAGPGTAAAVLGELHWAQVRMLRPEDYTAAALAAGRDTLSDISHGEVAAVYAGYLEVKKKRDVLDLDDLVTRCASLLEEDEVAAAAQRWRIRHVFVDEFQDVNPAQWRLLPRVARGRGATCSSSVTPDRPSTDGTGPTPPSSTGSPSCCPAPPSCASTTTTAPRPRSWAPPSAVLGAGPGQASRPDGPCPVVEGFDDDDVEATALARWLRRTHRPGRPWSHLAVLARTNSRLEPVARALSRAGIPHRMAGGAKEAAQARAALAELRRVPRARHLRSALAELVMAREARASFGRRSVAPDQDGPSADEDERAPYVALPPVLARLADEHALEFPDATVGEFLEWVAADGEGDMELDAVDGVELSTFHRAKGLEWPAVAVVGLENGMVPIAYATTPDALAEERRLLYVALTRAEDELWCSWARTRRAGERTWRCDPSPLLAALQEASQRARGRIRARRTPTGADASRCCGPGCPHAG